MTLAVKGVTGFAGLMCVCMALAQQPKPKDLNNVEIYTKYGAAGTLVYRFEDGILRYTFTEGPRKGAGGVDLDYTARKVGDEMYLIGWHDDMYSNHFTVLFDLENGMEYTNAIMFYGTDGQQVFFTEGTVEAVKPIE